MDDQLPVNPCGRCHHTGFRRDAKGRLRICGSCQGQPSARCPNCGALHRIGDIGHTAGPDGLAQWMCTSCVPPSRAGAR